MKRRQWRFEFIAGPFDGYRLDPVSAEFCSPRKDPPLEVWVWEEHGRTCIVRGADAAGPDAEKYMLDDHGHPDAYYVWSNVPEGYIPVRRAKEKVPA